MTAQPQALARCAIYTRQSVTARDQAFNSLAAQRESCVRFAEGKGWTVSDTHYDDGGYTGTNTDRPAFQQLLADIDAHAVDVVVVQRLDRISRDLPDSCSSKRASKQPACPASRPRRTSTPTMRSGDS